MQTRSSKLTAFLSSLHRAISERARAESKALHVTEKIMRALQIEQPAASPKLAWLPVCAFLDEAVKNVTASASAENPEQPTPFSSSLVDHAHALRALSPQLAWWHRPDAGRVGKLFASGHANATVIGQGGLEERDDVCVGISLMAPGIQYPDHHHSPEEVYLVLSAGQWRQAGGVWYEPGLSGLVHNPPNVPHAMRSGSAPLLATWCLWTGGL